MSRRPTPAASAVVTAGRRQTRGPLGPSTPDVTVFASSDKDGIGATPAGMEHKGRPASILVTDDTSAASRFPHREIISVGEEGARRAMLEAHFRARTMPHHERTIYVAGSAELAAAATDDAWKFVLECDAECPPPYAISAWRHQRTKGGSTTTFSRD